MNRLTRALFFASVIAVLLSLTVFAHSGGTDGQGGHYVGGTNYYHYHHGYPAHQHEDGVCPYENGYNAKITTDSDDYLWLIIATPASLVSLVFLINKHKKDMRKNHCETLGMVSAVTIVISGVMLFLLLFFLIISGAVENLPIAIIINFVLLIASIIVFRCCGTWERKRALKILPDFTMFYTQHGECYHSLKGCVALKGTVSVQSGTRETNYAPLLRRRPCLQCCETDGVVVSARKERQKTPTIPDKKTQQPPFKPSPRQLLPEYRMYYTDHGNCYHADRCCPSLKNATSVKWATKNINYNFVCTKRPCPKCCNIKDAHNPHSAKKCQTGTNENAKNTVPICCGDKQIEMQPVTSSNIESVGYCDKTLYVCFHSRSVYRYKSVPEAIYKELLKAPSAGKFFNAYVRDRFEGEYIGEKR